MHTSTLSLSYVEGTSHGRVAPDNGRRKMSVYLSRRKAWRRLGPESAEVSHARGQERFRDGSLTWTAPRTGASVPYQCARYPTRTGPERFRWTPRWGARSVLRGPRDSQRPRPTPPRGAMETARACRATTPTTRRARGPASSRPPTTTATRGATSPRRRARRTTGGRP